MYEQATGLYRSRRGVLFGVCRGVAEYFDIPVFGVRVITIIGFLITGLWPVGILYMAAALLMRPEPRFAWAPETEAPVDAGGPGVARRFHRAFQGLDRRLQRLESVVTDRERDWEDRLHTGRMNISR